MISLINTYLNGLAPIQNKILMYCLGSPSAIAMAPVLAIVEEKKHELKNTRPLDQITAWRFYKPNQTVAKRNSMRRHTFTSYVIIFELEVSKLSDSKMPNAEENYKYASKRLVEKKQIELTCKETEIGTPTAIIMRDHFETYELV
jgi:hypothetical protein